MCVWGGGLASVGIAELLLVGVRLKRHWGGGGGAALFKLRKEVRAAIKTLTVAEEATIEADAVLAGHDLHLTLTREDLERECEELFQVPPLAAAPLRRPGVGGWGGW